MRIGIDAMGGDYAPETVVSGAVLAIKELGRDAMIVLIGHKEKIDGELKKHDVSADRYEIVHAPDAIEMGETPIKAFTHKPHSSIAVGFGLLKEKKINAFASAGNTGAMLVGAMYTVKAIPGVIRPGLSTMIPKENGGKGVLLDVGANSDCKPDVLYQFGMLGSLYAENVYKILNPKVGLLSIGEEEGKGNLVTHSAYEIMKGTKLFNFIGNIEGRDLFNDKADVIVCDGFTGNIVLKQAESIYTLMQKNKFRDPFFDRFNYEMHGGSPILGVTEAVVVGHGISSPLAIKNMLLLSKDVAETKLADKIKGTFQYA